jgi:cell division protein FtsB
MIGMIGAVLFKRAIGNKYVLIAAGLAVGLSAALTWHYVDKAAAVRNAEQALADKVTIRTLEAQLEEIARRAEIAEKANKALELKAGLAEADARKAAQELEEYEQTTVINDQCVVDRNVLDRLQHN